MLCLDVKPEERILIQGPSIVKVRRVQGKNTVKLAIDTPGLIHTEDRFVGEPIEERLQRIHDALGETIRVLKKLREAGTNGDDFDATKCSAFLALMTNKLTPEEREEHQQLLEEVLAVNGDGVG